MNDSDFFDDKDGDDINLHYIHCRSSTKIDDILKRRREKKLKESIQEGYVNGTELKSDTFLSLDETTNKRELAGINEVEVVDVNGGFDRKRSFYEQNVSMNGILKNKEEALSIIKARSEVNSFKSLNSNDNMNKKFMYEKGYESRECNDTYTINHNDSIKYMKDDERDKENLLNLLKSPSTEMILNKMKSNEDDGNDEDKVEEAFINLNQIDMINEGEQDMHKTPSRYLTKNYYEYVKSETAGKMNMSELETPFYLKEEEGTNTPFIAFYLAGEQKEEIVKGISRDIEEEEDVPDDKKSEPSMEKDMIMQPRESTMDLRRIHSKEVRGSEHYDLQDERDKIDKKNLIENEENKKKVEEYETQSNVSHRSANKYYDEHIYNKINNSKKYNFLKSEEEYNEMLKAQNTGKYDIIEKREDPEKSMINDVSFVDGHFESMRLLPMNTEAFNKQFLGDLKTKQYESKKYRSVVSMEYSSTYPREGSSMLYPNDAYLEESKNRRNNEDIIGRQGSTNMIQRKMSEERNHFENSIRDNSFIAIEDQTTPIIPLHSKSNVQSYNASAATTNFLEHDTTRAKEYYKYPSKSLLKKNSGGVDDTETKGKNGIKKYVTYSNEVKEHDDNGTNIKREDSFLYMQKEKETMLKTVPSILQKESQKNINYPNDIDKSSEYIFDIDGKKQPIQNTGTHVPLENMHTLCSYDNKAFEEKEQSYNYSEQNNQSHGLYETADFGHKDMKRTMTDAKAEEYQVYPNENTYSSNREIFPKTNEIQSLRKGKQSFIDYEPNTIHHTNSNEPREGGGGMALASNESNEISEKTFNLLTEEINKNSINNFIREQIKNSISNVIEKILIDNGKRIPSKLLDNGPLGVNKNTLSFNGALVQGSEESMNQNRANDLKEKDNQERQKIFKKSMSYTDTSDGLDSIFLNYPKKKPRSFSTSESSFLPNEYLTYQKGKQLHYDSLSNDSSRHLTNNKENLKKDHINNLSFNKNSRFTFPPNEESNEITEEDFREITKLNEHLQSSKINKIINISKHDVEHKKVQTKEVLYNCIDIIYYLVNENNKKNKKLNNLMSEINNVNEYEKKIQNLSEENEKLKIELEKKGESFKKKELKEKATMNKKITEQMNKISGYEKDITIYKNKVTKLHNKIQSKEIEIDKLKKQYQTMLDEVENCKDEATKIIKRISNKKNVHLIDKHYSDLAKYYEIQLNAVNKEMKNLKSLMKSEVKEKHMLQKKLKEMEQIDLHSKEIKRRPSGSEEGEEDETGSDNLKRNKKGRSGNEDSFERKRKEELEMGKTKEEKQNRETEEESDYKTKYHNLIKEMGEIKRDLEIQKNEYNKKIDHLEQNQEIQNMKNQLQATEKIVEIYQNMFREKVNNLNNESMISRPNGDIKESIKNNHFLSENKDFLKSTNENPPNEYHSYYSNANHHGELNTLNKLDNGNKFDKLFLDNDNCTNYNNNMNNFSFNNSSRMHNFISTSFTNPNLKTSNKDFHGLKNSALSISEQALMRKPNHLNLHSSLLKLTKRNNNDGTLQNFVNMYLEHSQMNDTLVHKNNLSHFYKMMEPKMDVSKSVLQSSEETELLHKNLMNYEKEQLIEVFMNLCIDLRADNIFVIVQYVKFLSFIVYEQFPQFTSFYYKIASLMSIESIKFKECLETVKKWQTYYVYGKKYYFFRKNVLLIFKSDLQKVKKELIDETCINLIKNLYIQDSEMSKYAKASQEKAEYIINKHAKEIISQIIKTYMNVYSIDKINDIIPHIHSIHSKIKTQSYFIRSISSCLNLNRTDNLQEIENKVKDLIASKEIREKLRNKINIEEIDEYLAAYTILNTLKKYLHISHTKDLLPSISKIIQKNQSNL